MRLSPAKSVFGVCVLLLLNSCSPQATALVNAFSISAAASVRDVVRLPYARAAFLTAEPFRRDSGRPRNAAAPYDGGETGSAAAEECLTAAIYYEARSEAAAGQKAVAQVVLNRVRHPAFPSTICGVVFEGAERRTGCQFSFTCDGSMGQRRDPRAWQQARAIAKEALRGQVEHDVGLATHYHTWEVAPYWAPSLRRITAIGDHVFYVWRGAAGTPQAFRNKFASSLLATPAIAEARFARASAPAPTPQTALKVDQAEVPSAAPGFELVLGVDPVASEDLGGAAMDDAAF